MSTIRTCRGASLRRGAGLLISGLMLVSCGTANFTINKKNDASSIKNIGESWFVDVYVSEQDFNRIKGKGAFALYSSDCDSYKRSVEIGFFDDTGQNIDADEYGRHLYTFQLAKNRLNTAISQDWRTNLKCIYVESTGLGWGRYRSNILSLR